MSNAIYVANIGTDDAPLCRVGVCALADVPNDAEFVVTSPDAESVFKQARFEVAFFQKSETEYSVYIEALLCLAADKIRMICEGKITNVAYEHEIVKDNVVMPTDADFAKCHEASRPWVEAFSTRGTRLALSICKAIAEALNRDEELETVLIDGKFPEMRGVPKFVYKIECRGGEDVIVGGEMTIVRNPTNAVLRISEQSIDFCGVVGGIEQCDNYPLAEYLPKGVSARPMVDALVAFFARCYKKRM